MEGGKKTVAVAVLLIVIVGAVGLMIRGRTARTTPTDEVLRHSTEMIDRETCELMTRKVGEWRADGEENGKYKNPKTGKFTMVEPIKCASCGEKIPPVDLPPREKWTPRQTGNE